MLPSVATTGRACPPSTSLLIGPNGLSWPFATNERVVDAFSSMNRNMTTLAAVLTRETEYCFGRKTTASNSLGVYEKELQSLDPITEQPTTTTWNTTRWLYFNTARERDLAFMALSGRWAYLWWLMYGDEYNVTATTLASLPCGIEDILRRTRDDDATERVVARCEELAAILKSRMTDHVEYNLRGSRLDRVLVGRYNLLPLRAITDEADLLLARLWDVEDAYSAAGNLRDRMVFGS